MENLCTVKIIGTKKQIKEVVGILQEYFYISSTSGYKPNADNDNYHCFLHVVLKVEYLKKLGLGGE
jgi:hypothetical protein